MKTQALAIAISLALSTSAFATGSKRTYADVDVQQGQQQQQSVVDNSRTSFSLAQGAQENSQSISFQEQKNRNIRIKNVPSPDAPSINPSHPCALTFSAGVSGAGFGGAFGKAYVDEKCNVREWARLMFQMGARDAAIAVMCALPEAAAAPECKGIQDYNQEMQLLEYGHEQLVKENELLREELKARGKQYEETVDRLSKQLNKELSK